MNKNYIVLFLSLMMLLLLAGCSEKKAETISEPDTSTRTQIHAIEDGRTATYRFHMERVKPKDSTLRLTILDANEDAGEQAQNWAVATIGKGMPLAILSSSNTFFNGDYAKIGAEHWDTSTYSDLNWKLFSPGNFESVESADIVLTLSRQGETLRATLDVNGARSWDAQQAIGGFGEETRYLYLSVDGIELSDITFSESAGPLWLPSVWLRLGITVVFLIVAFLLHFVAKKKGEEVYITDTGLSLITGAWVLSLSLFVTLLLVRSGSSISRNLYILPFALPVEGTAFWVTAGILGLIVFGLTAFLIWLAIDDMENPVKYLFFALVFGVFHAIWYTTLVLVFLSLVGQIVELIVTCVLVVIACIVIYAFLTGTDVKPVIKTTRVYNSVGNLVSEKKDIDYVIVPKDDDKK